MIVDFTAKAGIWCAAEGVIAMIEPTVADVGCWVIYHPLRGEPEQGVVTSFNQAVVFVRYGEVSSKATKREDLTWVRPGDQALGCALTVRAQCPG
jgi:hypothetical protein